MTSAEICALSQASLDKVQVLKQKFDAALEALVVSGSKENLEKVEALRQQLDDELRTPLIARSTEQVSDKTLIYIGALQPGIFKKFPKSIEHIYTSFPSAELKLESLYIGGQASKELREFMERRNIMVTDYAMNMMNDPDFVTSKQPEAIDLIRLRVRDLGLTGNPTMDQIYERIAELGLELCPPDAGAHYLLSPKERIALGDMVTIGMKHIIDLNGDPNDFVVSRGSGGQWLYDCWARPKRKRNPDDEFLFRIRRDA